MPIIVEDYKWKQTIFDITVQVPLKGVSEYNADIFTSQRYIKVKFEKYFFEAILLHSINVNKSQCKITDKEVIFELRKNDEIDWVSLQPNISKKEKTELKRQLLDEEYLRLQELEKAKANKKAELKRVAIQQQIELDTKQREHIEKIKNIEKTRALGDVNQWSNTVDSSVGSVKKNNKQKSFTARKQQTPIIAVKLSKTAGSLPLPRSIKTLEIDFTPREFPTPSRESKLEEENEWLRKQAAARRSAGFVSEDIRPEEKNPQFLKTKGDEFLKNKNYLGALSAYSFGIKIAPKFVDLYIARSEAHLLAGNFHRVIEDCSAALDLLKPEVLINLKERALCVGRRGEALCKIGLKKQGVAEIKISVKLTTNDYFNHVLELIENDSD